MRNDEVQDLTTQLNLQLQQTEFFARLEKAIGDKDAQTRGVRKEDEQTREVAHKIEVEQNKRVCHHTRSCTNSGVCHRRQGHSKEPKPFPSR
jgi:hypothetical protein